MKTIRLLYPDHLGGGLDAYHFGANLLAHILPENPDQPLLRVPVTRPDDRKREITHGIYARDEILAGIQAATHIIEDASPDRIITIGGDCLVSLAPFDYLHGKYANTGIIWIDTHPDVSRPENGYPNAHAMVLAALMGKGAPELNAQLKHPPFAADQILYVGLQDIHNYQQAFLDEAGVQYRVQTDRFLAPAEIRAFTDRFDHVVVHFDIDVLDAGLFHSTYFANKELVGDGSGSGRMTLAELADILKLIDDHVDVVGFTIAEYLPFDEHRLHEVLSGVRILTN